MLTLEEQQFRAQIKSLLKDLIYETRLLNKKVSLLIPNDLNTLNNKLDLLLNEDDEIQI